MRTPGSFSLAFSAWLIVATVAFAEGPEVPLHPSFDRDIQPLLKARCAKCHGPAKSRGKLNLASPRALARGGETGPAIEPGNPDEGSLWSLIADDEMPPKPEEPLSAIEKAMIRRWIEQGASGLPRSDDGKDHSPASDHWAFAPASRPEPPTVRNDGLVETPVDRFIERALEDRGLTLGPEADRATIIRRLSFDLLGLPPTPEEITAYERDDRPDAHERLVERLLASPHYGERWGKFWLDEMGYAESNGYFSADSERPLAYRYRDYVIRAFNRDRPLDEIVREQLAGDELSGYKPGGEVTPAIIDRLVATHFLRNGQDGTGESDGNPDEVRADKIAVLDGATQIIASSFLGLTFQCAKCHDHKFEPVKQKDYYQLHSVLYPAFNVEKWVKPNERFVDAAPADIVAPWAAQEKMVNAEVERLKKELGPRPNETPAEKKVREEKLNKALEAANAKRLPHPGRIAWVADLAAEPADAPLLVRGNPMTTGPKVDPGVPGFLADPDNPFAVRPPFPGSRSTGRRLALAKWLTRPGTRPAALLARVFANRTWQHHFGTGLVPTSDNLGYSGATPSHPALLEYLASELARSGWSTKALHRMILNSAVWRQSSAPRPEAKGVDPDNRLLARYPLRRLDAESLRDAMLAASGELDGRQGGPSVATHRTGSGEVVPEAPGQDGLRRSIYLQQRRTQLDSLLETFDAPSIVTVCTRRLPATTPLQSLSMLNSEFVVARANRLSERLERECPGEGDEAAQRRLDRLFLMSVGRPPAAREREAATGFLHSQPARHPDQTASQALKRAWADLCQMVLASNTYLYLD